MDIVILGGSGQLGKTLFSLLKENFKIISLFDETELKDLIKPNHLAVAGDLSSAKSEKISHNGLNAGASTPVPSSMGS